MMLMNARAQQNNAGADYSNSLRLCVKLSVKNDQRRPAEVLTAVAAPAFFAVELFPDWDLAAACVVDFWVFELALLLEE